MARRRGRTRRSGGRRKPRWGATAGALISGVQIATGASSGSSPIDAIKVGDWPAVGVRLKRELMAPTNYVPIVAGVAVSLIAAKSGVNRYLPKWLNL